MKKILISAGHDDVSVGAAATHNGVLVKEADVMRDFRDIVAYYLDKKGVDFITDGQKGVNIPLKEVIKFVPKNGVSVEFHLNAGPTSATGVETLSSPDMYGLGSKLCEAVSARLGIRNRGAKPENSGQHKTLAFVQAGGLILELFFINNKSDLEKFNAVKWLLARDISEILVEEASK